MQKNTDKTETQRWLDTAVSGIRFWYDRNEVAQELREHLEDKLEALQSLGNIAPEEAERLALAQMGDPEALKDELARIHRPWPGRLWIASKILLGIVLVPSILIVSFYLVFGLMGSLVDWEIREMVFGRPSSSTTQADPQLVDLECAKERIFVDGRMITMEGASMLPPQSPGGGRSVWVGLRTVSIVDFWVPNSYFCHYMTAVDDLGNHYEANPSSAHQNQYLPLWAPPELFEISGAHQNQYLPLWAPPHLFTDRFWIHISNVDPQARWLRLEYDRMGRSFAMTVEMKEAVS